MNGKWHKVSLFFLLCIALIGSYLRATPYISAPFNYGFLVHAHSHVAFQGWVYTALMLLITRLFLTREQVLRGRYALQFKITVVIISGVMLSFSMQGYALFSILFSTLFQLMNYWLMIRFFIDSRSVKNKGPALLFIQSGFVLGALSSIAPYFVGYLSAKGLNETEIYDSAIYFFLHFQYNGWFLFSIIGVILKLLEGQLTIDTKTQLYKTHHFLLIATLLTYTHSLLGMSFAGLVRVPAFIGALLQIIAAGYLIRNTRALHLEYLDKKFWGLFFLRTALVCFSLKIALQLVSILPGLGEMAFGNRNLIMAYMHLCLIGMISLALISSFLSLNWIQPSKRTVFGCFSLFTGFVLSELYLIFSGFAWLIINPLLLFFSLLMAFGIFCLLISPMSSATKLSNRP